MLSVAGLWSFPHSTRSSLSPRSQESVYAYAQLAPLAHVSLLGRTGRCPDFEKDRKGIAIS